MNTPAGRIRFRPPYCHLDRQCRTRRPQTEDWAAVKLSAPAPKQRGVVWWSLWLVLASEQDFDLAVGWVCNKNRFDNCVSLASRILKSNYLCCVKYVGRWVVYAGTVSESNGQQTPGIKRRLKHSESRKLDKSSSRLGHTLRSSQRPAEPLGVMHRFSPSFPSRSSSLAENNNIQIIYVK